MSKTNDMEIPALSLKEIAARLGCGFRDAGLLELALTHPSAVGDDPANQRHNQRLEFLGDAVLQLVLTRELYEKFPDAGEGPMTKARAEMVNRHTLAAQARRLNLGHYLRFSRGEEINGGRERLSALADGFEALLGAIFLDGGFEIARTFVLQQFREAFGELEVMPNLDNPKGELQEMLQTTSPVPPKYAVVSASGPDHDRVFECTVLHQGVELGRGAGKSKKAAESQAALSALLRLRQTDPEPPLTVPPAGNHPEPGHAAPAGSSPAV
jgi:ribonuclease III